jgi:hypothetical protein
MSVKAMSVVWESDLTRAEKMILLAYADHADDEGGSVFPAVNRIAWKTGYSRRQVQRVTQGLVAYGYMSEVGKSRFGTIVYHINLDHLPALPPYVGGDSSTKIGGDILTPRDKTTQGGVTKRHGGGDILTRGGDIAMSPDPSLDPSVNHHNESSIAKRQQKLRGQVPDEYKDIVRS